ncbi:hypothetical protein [Aequorivita sp. CIP111184]|uniref:hypothetical protein n=1 Tax=Aequorivita sp. CIP111184 TaxID=2211356 RepID=UPI000DBC04F7|nr:hypothetical protein [Aequorivita sp. CIP111184]SRX55494.1 hypothetical protein AEQU1_02516 [Aequorivita sp. CIP111184]
MIDLPHATNQIQLVKNFQDLVSTPFQGEINTICWNRQLTGDFSEIVKQVELNENIATLGEPLNLLIYFFKKKLSWNY